MSKYKISLIIPCYNLESITNADYSFKKTFDSIKNQTFGFDNIELILVNNGSTDNTLNIITDISASFENVLIYNIPKNSGNPSLPRNMGIENASADYIMFLDADDYLKDDAIEKMYDYLVKHDLDLVKSNNYDIVDGKTKIRDRGLNKPFFIENGKNLQYVNFCIWGTIYNKDFLNKNNIRFKDVRGEDSLFTMDCIYLTNKKIYVMNDFPSVYYNMDNDNSMCHTENNFQMLETYISALDSIFEKMTKYSSKRDIEEAMVENRIPALMHLYYSSENKENKLKMFNLLNRFFKKYESYKFVQTYSLNFFEYIFWRVIYNLILLNFSKLTLVILDLMKLILRENKS